MCVRRILTTQTARYLQYLGQHYSTKVGTVTPAPPRSDPATNGRRLMCSMVMCCVPTSGFPIPIRESQAPRACQRRPRIIRRKPYEAHRWQSARDDRPPGVCLSREVVVPCRAARVSRFIKALKVCRVGPQSNTAVPVGGIWQ